MAASDQRYRLEKIAYASDGLTVYAYLYAPAKAQGRYPTDTSSSRRCCVGVGERKGATSLVARI